MSDDRIMVICVLCTDPDEERLMVPGSVIDVCSACERSVWVSPEGITFAYTTCPQASIVCTECMTDLDRPDEVDVVPGSGFSKNVAQELVEVLKRNNAWRRRNGGS